MRINNYKKARFTQVRYYTFFCLTIMWLVGISCIEQPNQPSEPKTFKIKNSSGCTIWVEKNNAFSSYHSKMYIGEIQKISFKKGHSGTTVWIHEYENERNKINPYVEAGEIIVVIGNSQVGLGWYID
ncbi:MAG: hypothetical protein ACE5HX_05215 [bacterium]